jgi:Ni/Fe-hydrogenase 1 B-type cytochrome subunit
VSSTNSFLTAFGTRRPGGSTGSTLSRCRGLSLVGTLILVGGSLGVTAAGKVTITTIHVWIGYAMTLSLLWLFVGAFFGNRYARWKAILPGGPGYVAALP